MKPPEQIYLQCYDEAGELLNLAHDDVTWCVDQINENDAVYVLARGKPELEEETDPCEGCGNQGMVALFRNSPASGNSLCRACEGYKEETE